MANSLSIPDNINLFQRGYYSRKSAKYMGTSDPVTIKKHVKPKEKPKREEKMKD
ncbi:hypothetical protein [Chondrinema litorale]|uniref:hypothetical protein n=1 Tax=Chondrinema litorale TaxID=2994555 RepID=UPI0025438CA1|nr:hypothetical protein [Chondrinema litorale]UZR95174.1 hypothetical protein OQ292_05000 [Chondrinema litorale]